MNVSFIADSSPMGHAHKKAYELECDWHLIDSCNFRCDYCYFSDEILGRPIRAYASHEEWRDSFDRTGATWLVNITGGEPSIYPDFTALCEAITTAHYITINTNLTGESLLTFPSRVSPEKVLAINASLHWDQRRLRKKDSDYIAKLDCLRDHGYPIFSSIVATPCVLENFQEILREYEPYHIFPIPKMLIGRHAGGIYPGAYTQEHLLRFSAFSELARFHLSSASIDFSSLSVNPFLDSWFLLNKSNYKGRPCAAGRTFVRIDKDGSVHRCGPNTCLGNILQGSMRLFSEDSNCDDAYCRYFCHKYSR